LGEFFAESLIFAETANSIGAIQVAGSTQNTQTPFFIAACDYVLVGDEFYAASAYLSREPVLVGSLVGQDWCKLLVGASIIVGFIVASIEGTNRVDWAWKDGVQEKREKIDLMPISDTTIFKLFRPSPSHRAPVTVERETLTTEEVSSDE
jgi:hypothetical protein